MRSYLLRRGALTWGEEGGGEVEEGERGQNGSNLDRTAEHLLALVTVITSKEKRGVCEKGGGALLAIAQC